MAPGFVFHSAMAKSVYSIVQKCPMGETAMDNGSCNNVPPVPGNIPNNNAQSSGRRIFGPGADVEALILNGGPEWGPAKELFADK